jgi:hypothetical protein
MKTSEVFGLKTAALAKTCKTTCDFFAEACVDPKLIGQQTGVNSATITLISKVLKAARAPAPSKAGAASEGEVAASQEELAASQEGLAVPTDT